MKKQKEEIENQSASAAKNIINDQKGVVGVASKPNKAVKPSSDKQPLFKKLKLDTNVGKLIAFMLSFALIGGIYLAFRSFAGTPSNLEGLLFVSQYGGYSNQNYVYDPKLQSFTETNDVVFTGKINDLGNRTLHFDGDTKEFFAVNVYGDYMREKLHTSSVGDSSLDFNWMPGSNKDFIFVDEELIDDKYGSRVVVVKDSEEIIVQPAVNGYRIDLIGDHQGSMYFQKTTYGAEAGISDIQILKLTGENTLEVVSSYKGSEFKQRVTGWSNTFVISPTSQEIMVRGSEDGDTTDSIFVFDFDFKIIRKIYIENMINLSVRNNPNLGWSPDGKYIFLNHLVLSKNGQLIQTVGDENNNIADWEARPPEPVNLGVFKPTNATTRADMSVFLYWASGKPAVPTASTVCGEGKPGPFKDVLGTHKACVEIEWLSKQGITTGYSDGTFKPDAVVTRQAMSAFLYRAGGKPAIPTAAAKCGTGKLGPFKDVSGTHPFCKEIEWMRAQGISTGYSDGTYKPTANVSRQATAAFLYRLSEEKYISQPDPLYSDVPKGASFYTEIQWLGDQSL